MTEWEARYKALLAGVDDEALVTTAESLVNVAIQMSVTTMLPFDEAFYALLDAARTRHRVVIPGLKATPTWRRRLAAWLVHLASQVARIHIQIEDFGEWCE